MAYRQQNNLGIAVVIVTVVLILVGAGLFSINVVRSTALRFDVTGTVDSEPQGKTFGSVESGMTTKFSVRLATPTGTSIVNCTSTQCASLSPGDEVKLSCYNEWNGFVQPTEVECRFDKLIEAAPADAP